MATFNPSFAPIRGPSGGIDAVVATWNGPLTTGDVGLPIQRLDLVDRSVQVVCATWGGGTVVFEGSNDGVNYFTLTNPAGTSTSFTANGLMQVTEAVAWIRPRCTSTVGAAAVISLTMRRSLRGG